MKNAVEWQVDDSDDSEGEVSRPKRRNTIANLRDKKAYLLKRRADLIYWKMQKEKYKGRGLNSQSQSPLKKVIYS